MILTALLICLADYTEVKHDPPVTASLPTSYRAEKMFAYRPSRWRAISGITVLTEGGLAAGFECDLIGNHGDLIFPMPIVWTNGKKALLPVPEQEQGFPKPAGQVTRGNDRVLVGHVRVGYVNRPAAWHPDPELGWAKPILTVLSRTEKGSAVLSPSGEVFASWDKAAERVWKAPPIEHHYLGFQLIGFDRSGAMYGNLYDGLQFGGGIGSANPARYDGEVWNLIDRSFDAQINDVNLSGDAVGTLNRQAVMWSDGYMIVLAKVDRGVARGIALNDHGTAIISSSDGCFVWRDGKKLALNPFVPGLKGPNVQAINNKGQIVIRGHLEDVAGDEFYLLTPAEAK